MIKKSAPREGQPFWDDEAEQWLTLTRGISLDDWASQVLADVRERPTAPVARLETMALFLKQDYADNPVAQVVQQILRPLMEVDFKDPANRKGRVARAMGLSNGWPNTKQKRDELLVIERLFKPENKTHALADQEAAQRLRKSPDTIRKIRNKAGVKGKPGRKPKSGR